MRTGHWNNVSVQNWTNILSIRVTWMKKIRLLRSSLEIVCFWPGCSWQWLMTGRWGSPSLTFGHTREVSKTFKFAPYPFIYTFYFTDLIYDEHITRESVKDATDGIGLKHLNRALEEILQHFLMKIGPGTGSWVMWWKSSVINFEPFNITGFVEIDLIYQSIDCPSHSYPLAQNIVEICQNYHTQGETGEKLEEISDAFHLAVFTLHPVAKEKIHVDLSKCSVIIDRKTSFDV